MIVTEDKTGIPLIFCHINIRTGMITEMYGDLCSKIWLFYILGTTHTVFSLL